MTVLQAENPTGCFTTLEYGVLALAKAPEEISYLISAASYDGISKISCRRFYAA